MAITSYEDVVAAKLAGQILPITYRKISTTAEAAGIMHSLWRVGPVPLAGGDGAAGSGTPGAGGSALDRDPASLSVGWADQSPDDIVLEFINARSTIAGTFVLFDRLVSVSGIALSSTGNKNANTVALPRSASGVGVMAYLEVTTATATTTPVVSLSSYTDQDGNTGQVGGTISFPAAATNVDVLVGPLPLASGDYGVQAVATVNVGTAGSAGVANLVLLREICRFGVVPNMPGDRGFLSEPPILPLLEDGVSLMIGFIPVSGSIITIDGSGGGIFG